MEKKASVAVFLLLFLLALASTSKTIAIRTDTRTIFVDKNNINGPWEGSPEHPYQNMTSALDSASNGDVIFVANGTYYENLVIAKSVSLQGQDEHGTILDGNLTGDVLRIVADNVTITRFTIQNAGPTLGFSGIHASSSSGHNISFNTIRNNFHGIWLYVSHNNAINNNTITYNEYGISASASNSNFISLNDLLWNNITGIGVTDSAEETISNNNVSNNDFGIQLIASINNNITSNSISHNVNYGIYLFNSNSSAYSANDVSLNLDSGIWLMQSAGNFISNNSIRQNARFGIYLTNSTANVLSDNDISENHQYGIRSEYADANVIFNNALTSNRIRGILFFYSHGNKAFHNNFIQNFQQLETVYSTSFLDSDMEGNYWSDYNGTDNNRDGIGDSPHVIMDQNDRNNDTRDNYPLMGPYEDMTLTFEESNYHFPTISNSTISEFRFDLQFIALHFQVENPNNASGFCRISIPQKLVKSPYTVLVDNETIQLTVLPKSNTTQTYVYFEYNQSAREIEILPTQSYELIQAIEALRKKYDDLNQAYDKLFSDYSSLNQLIQQTLGDYNNFTTMYGALNQTYWNLLQTYEELVASNNRTEAQYSFMNAAFWCVSIVMVATTLATSALTIKYRKIYALSRTQKDLIDKYKVELEQLSLMNSARNQFETDVQRRKEKIEKFEGKYGIEIRPHDSLDEIVKNLELKRKKED